MTEPGLALDDGRRSEDVMEPDEREHDHADNHHEHRGLRGLLASVIGHSHDPRDSIDDALTADARGIRAVKVSLLILAATATAATIDASATTLRPRP